MPSTPTDPGWPDGWGSLPAWQLPLAQLCDSAAPTGAFSHSLGLETYAIDGRVHDEYSFGDWLAAMLTGPLATGDALAVRLAAEAVREGRPEQVWWVDQHLYAQTLPRQTRTPWSRWVPGCWPSRPSPVRRPGWTTTPLQSRPVVVTDIRRWLSP